MRTKCFSKNASARGIIFRNIILSIMYFIFGALTIVSTLILLVVVARVTKWGYPDPIIKALVFAIIAWGIMIKTALWADNFWNNQNPEKQTKFLTGKKHKNGDYNPIF